MEAFQSILLKDLDISVQGTRVYRLNMNRHRPRVDRVGDHSHSFDQFLLYLRGAGIQRISGEEVSVRRGSLLLLERNKEHGFEKLDNQSPVCLAIDLRLANRKEWPLCVDLRLEKIREIEQILVQLAGRKKRSVSGFQIAAEVLQILSLFDSGRKQQGDWQTGSLSKLILTTVQQLGLAEKITPSIIASQLSMTVDQLNRQLKMEQSATVGELLSTIRFEAADRLIRSTDLSIGEIGDQVGFIDQNYFTRWFRKQCGQTPTQWRKNR